MDAFFTYFDGGRMNPERRLTSLLKPSAQRANADPQESRCDTSALWVQQANLEADAAALEPEQHGGKRPVSRPGDREDLIHQTPPSVRDPLVLFRAASLSKIPDVAGPGRTHRMNDAL